MIRTVISLGCRLQPVEVAMPDKTWSFFENGMPGLHLIINPQKPLPPEARIHAKYVDHSLTLSGASGATIYFERPLLWALLSLIWCGIQIVGFLRSTAPIDRASVVAIGLAIAVGTSSIGLGTTFHFIGRLRRPSA
jgi:hypothetical protein